MRFQPILEYKLVYYCKFYTGILKFGFSPEEMTCVDHFSYDIHFFSPLVMHGFLDIPLAGAFLTEQ